jgi:hypothetical protein
MRSTLSTKVVAPTPMPHGRAADLTVERVIPKKHRADVLRGLSKAPAGLPHHTIQYDIVRGSVASAILEELVALGLVEWHDNLYFATEKGKETIVAFDRFRAVAGGSSGNGGVGGR